MNERRGPLRRLAPLLLLVLLAAALLVGPGMGRWRDGADAARAAALREQVEALAPGSLVIVGFDPDLVTYAEIRPAARALLEALREARLRIATLSFSPEGRALASAELAATGIDALDIGFLPGGEAALVAAVRSVIPVSASGPVADAARSAGGGLAAFDLALVVGGGDIGPRTWVEQVRPRAPELPIVALVPSFTRPELEPYLASGQLAGLVTGPDAVAALSGTGAELDRRADGLLVGLLMVIAVLLATGTWPHVARRRTVGAEPEATE